MARKFSLHASWETPLSNTTVLVQIARGHSREDPRGDAPRLQPPAPPSASHPAALHLAALWALQAAREAPRAAFCWYFETAEHHKPHQSLSIDTRFTNKTDSRHDTCVGVRATAATHMRAATALPLDGGPDRRAVDRLVEGLGRVRQLEGAAHAHRRDVDGLGADVDAVGAAEGV